MTEMCFTCIVNIGCNVMPPKDVHEKEQFKSLCRWVQEALGNANMAAQVSLTLWSLQMLHQPLLHSIKIFSCKFCLWKLLISKHLIVVLKSPCATTSHNNKYY